MYKKIIKRGEKEYCYYVSVRGYGEPNLRYWFFSEVNQENKKTGFHNLIIVSDKNPTSTQTEYKKLNLYKSFSIHNYFLTKMRSHNLVIALDLRSSVLHRHLGSNSSLVMDIPASASKKR